MNQVSIIIPCLNSAKTIRRCLDSVLSQDYGKFEVIVINGVSTDGTTAILKEYQKKFKNLRVKNNVLGKVSRARNIGLKLARGEYIQFVDSDDNFIRDNVLSTLVSTMEQQDVDLVVCGFTHPCFQAHLESGVYDLTDQSSFLKYYQDFFTCSMPWNKLFRRESITADFDESISFAEDEIFNLANLNNIKKVAVLNDVLYNYYCPSPGKGSSLVNNLFARNDFYKAKNTIWYGSVGHVQRREMIYKKFFKNLKGDIEFIRLFDFFFYDFAFMSHLGVDIKLKHKQCDEILKHEVFRQVLSSKEKFGLKLKSKNMQKLRGYMHEFVELSSAAFIDIKKKHKRLKLYIVLFGIFGRCFFRPSGELGEKDLMCGILKGKDLAFAPELRYLKKVFKNTERPAAGFTELAVE